MSGREGVDAMAGAAVVRVDLMGTVVAVVAGAVGLASRDLARTVLTPVSFVLGGVGVLAFMWSYLRAVERSRTSEISVSQLYFVAGDVAPRPVRRALRWALWAQVLVGVGVMVTGFSRTEPEEFNWAATAIVVPLFGMGMNGVWVALHGQFGPRILTPGTRKRSRQKPESGTGMEQNSPHG